MSAVTWLAGSPPIDVVVISDDQHGIYSVAVWRSAESPDTAIGYILGQSGAPGVDYGVTCLPLGTVQSRFDGTIARSRVEALELDRYVVDRASGVRP
jgi:hypothetical protein